MREPKKKSVPFQQPGERLTPRSHPADLMDRPSYRWIEIHLDINHQKACSMKIISFKKPEYSDRCSEFLCLASTACSMTDGDTPSTAASLRKNLPLARHILTGYLQSKRSRSGGSGGHVPDGRGQLTSQLMLNRY